MFCIAVVVVVNIFILLIAANILCSIVWYKLGANIKKKKKQAIYCDIKFWIVLYNKNAELHLIENDIFLSIK